MTKDRKLIQRMLDGDLDAAEEARLRARAAQDPALAGELAAFDAIQLAAGGLPRPRSVEGLEKRILARIAKTRAPEPGLRAGLRSFFSAPHTWAASAALTAGLMAVVACAWWLGYRTGSARIREVASPQASREVVVRFSLNVPNARSVEVAGDFNAWRPERGPLAQGTEGAWSVTLKLPRGRHEYLFVIDGKRWVPDPSAAELVDDGFGGKNAVIEVL